MRFYNRFTTADTHFSNESLPSFSVEKFQSKNQREISACEQKKLQARKQIFVQTSFSHSTSKLERENFTPQNHSLSHSTSCFGLTKALLQSDFKIYKNV